MTRKLSYNYNPDLKVFSQSNRKAKDHHEELMWNQLRKRRFKNLYFSRQKLIGSYIVDFFCFEIKLIIEIDGASHVNKQQYDKKRDDFFLSLGLKIIHISTNDMDRDFDGVMRWLDKHPVFDDVFK